MRENILQFKRDILSQLSTINTKGVESGKSVTVHVDSILGKMPLSFSVAVPMGRQLIEFVSVEGKTGIDLTVHNNMLDMYKPWDIMEAAHFEPKPTDALFATQDKTLVMTNHLPTAGAVGVISDASGGKSSLVWDFVANDGKNVGVNLLNIGEPESLTSGTIYDVFLGLLISASEGKKVLLVDSLREILLNVPGDLRAGGVSKGVPTMLTTFERLAKVAEMMVVVIVNPSDSVDDEETDFTEGKAKRTAFKQLLSDMRSSMSYTVRILKTSPVEQGFLPLQLAVSARYHGRDWKRTNVRVALQDAAGVKALEKRIGGALVDDSLDSLIDDISQVQLTGRFNDDIVE